jgi:hypothetical protein
MLENYKPHICRHLVTKEEAFGMLKYRKQAYGSVQTTSHRILLVQL